MKYATDVNLRLGSYIRGQDITQVKCLNCVIIANSLTHVLLCDHSLHETWRSNSS